MASLIVVMAQMNHRPAQYVIVPLASSSVRMATVLTLASSVTVNQIAPTVQTRTKLFAV